MGVQKIDLKHFEIASLLFEQRKGHIFEFDSCQFGGLKKKNESLAYQFRDFISKNSFFNVKIS